MSIAAHRRASLTSDGSLAVGRRGGCGAQGARGTVHVQWFAERHSVRSRDSTSVALCVVPEESACAVGVIECETCARDDIGACRAMDKACGKVDERETFGVPSF